MNRYIISIALAACVLTWSCCAAFHQPFTRPQSIRLVLSHGTASSFQPRLQASETNDNSLSPGETFVSLPSNGVAPENELTLVEGNADEGLRFRDFSFDFTQAAMVGLSTGVAVSVFKLSIEEVRGIFFEREFLVNFPVLLAAIPACGGLLVGIILLLGALPPGLRGTVVEVDKMSKGPPPQLAGRINGLTNAFKKSAAAVATLGSGCSLGPEGPCVELGMNVARSYMDVKPKVSGRAGWNRQLLACGASAGVAAGFSAPIAGIFFALEVMQNTFSDLDSTKVDQQGSTSQLSGSSAIAPVLISSVLSALVSQAILGEHLVFKVSAYSLQTPLVELPLYLMLGAASGFVAFTFSQAAKLSQAFFDGQAGNDKIREAMSSLPKSVKPILGGLFCGVVGLQYPQTLFFGYETLNALLSNIGLPTTLLLTLLVTKIITTAVSAGSGLVGGTFAPSLFFGAMTGASFHRVANLIVSASLALMGAAGFTQIAPYELADVAAYAMVGAASVLAALFRAPLTASLLLFELTLDYKVILPLMASAGIGSVVADILDAKFKRVLESRQAERVDKALQKDLVERRQKRRDQDSVSWGDLSE